MNEITKKIKKHSNTFYFILQYVFVFTIIGLAGVLVYIIWHFAGLQMDTVTVGERIIQTPVLFKIGNTNVALPVVIGDGRFINIDLAIVDWEKSTINFIQIVSLIVNLVALTFAKKIFKHLRDGGSPFSGEVIENLKKLAIALLCIGVFNGLNGLIPAGVVWMICLVFRYGRELQTENDSIL